MFLSFIKTALRFLWRNKAYSFLNFLCLTFGLTCSILAFLHIKNVLNYDKFHKNYERLYAVEANVTYFNGDRFPKEVMSASLTGMLEEIPEIESLTRVVIRSNVFANDTVSFNETGIYADDNFLSVFTFPLQAGNIAEALSDANSIVISEKMALKFFGSVNCVGRSLFLKRDSSEEAYKITGILKKTTSPSYLQFEYLIPFTKFISENEWANEAGASVCQIWALLHNNSDKKVTDGKIKDLIKTHEATLNQELFLFPLKEKILYYYSGGRRIWREMQYLVLAGSIGFAILLIACFNFINLAIAMNIRRYREAGIRKVVGARRQSIIIQYLGETIILTLISLLVAIDLAGFLASGFNSTFRSDVAVNMTDYRMLLFFIGISGFTALVSGLFPGLYLSSSNPLNILKGKVVTSNSFSKFRQSLIIFQFTIPIILIIFMFIIRAQDRYIRNFDLGFEKEKLIIINNTAKLDEHKEGVKSDIQSLPGVKSVSFSDCYPVNGATVTNEVNWEGKDPSKKLHFWSLNTDFGYADAVNLNITSGRYFDRSFISDSTNFLINDIAANVMEYDDPVGHQIELEGRKGTIIGVFRDYHAIDLSGPYTPTIITLNRGNSKYLLVSYSTGDFMELREKMGDIIKKYDPDIEYNPLTFADLRKRTELTTTSGMIGVAFIIAILLACLGLSGLASFNAESRTKEIGIRKVNGGTTVSVMRLLGKNYTKWIVISTLFALPVAFLLGNIFLQRFNFRTAFPIWALLAGPVITYLIAVSTVALQSWKAASKNPVDALRYE